MKLIPIVGPGMMFFSFVFVSRRWETDESRIKHRVGRLSGKNDSVLRSTQELSPMWLLIFPEGTNLSDNTRMGSQKWAAKVGLEDLKHTLLPRSTGLQYCIQELDRTIEWVYDCTLIYDGVP